MEEILASIRRIIEDSEPAGQKPVENGAVPDIEFEIDEPAETAAFRAELAEPAAPQPQRPSAERMPAPQAAQAPQAPRSMADIHASIRKEPAQPAAQVHPLRPSADAAPAPRPAQPRPEQRAPAEPARPVQQPQAAAPQAAPRPAQQERPVDSQIAAEIESVAAILRPSVDAAKAPVQQAPQQAEAPRPQAPAPAAAARPEVQRGMLVSDRARTQVTASFGELAEAYQTIRKRSLADAAEEMMRPMLKDWLDNNLPRIVERLVREEIERVARGAD